MSYTHTTADGAMDLTAVLWVDRERRYFIASTSTTLPGTPYDRLRWRQGKVTAARVALIVPQPQVAAAYYRFCSPIDRCHRCRQDDVRLDHKLFTNDWSMRVNMSLLGMCIADSWLLYSGARGDVGGLSQHEFLEILAEQLIDNTFETAGLRPRGSAEAAPAVDESVPLR